MNLFLHRSRQRGRQRGSILVICLVIAGVGTIGAAAFFSLIQAKSEEALARETALTRRAREANSDVLVKEVMLQRTSATIDASVIGADSVLAGDWGACQILDYTALGSAPMGYSGSVRLNRTGAVADTALSADIYGSVIVDGNRQWKQFQAKSIHPALAGDLLVVESQKATGLPVIGFTGNLSIEGRAVFWQSNYATTTASLRADRVILANPASPKLGLLDTTGSAILPDNLPLPPTTSGHVAGAPAFNGISQVIDNPDTAFNDYLNTVSPLTGAVLPGDSPFIHCSGAASNPTTADDSILLALITAATGLPASVHAALQPYAPLSSAVLTTAISQATTGADVDVLLDILADNFPLPTDVLTQVINGTAPLSNTQIWDIVRQNPVAVAIDGSGTAYVDLDDPATDHVFIQGSVDSLTIRGQEDSTSLANAATLSPLVIVLNDDSAKPLTLTGITLEGANRRPLILAIRKTTNNTATDLGVYGSTAFPEWRAIMDLDNVGLEISADSVSTVTFKGGIRTNRSINVPFGSVVLTRETDADTIAALRPLASRNAWVESFDIDAAP